jgi:hypothetical protein
VFQGAPLTKLIPSRNIHCVSLSRKPVTPDEQIFPRGASIFAPARAIAILSRVRTPQPKPTPNWKEIILASPDWPEDLVIPQNDKLPKGSECLQDSMYTNEHWDWELWRHPDGHCYYLKVWPIDEGKFGKPNTPGVKLTVMETFHFLMTNWVPRDVLVDLALERPDMRPDSPV